MAATRQWALITGVSAGGLGDAMAVAFLSRGVNVIATSPDVKALDYLKPTAGSQEGFLVQLQLDVTDNKSIAAAVRRTEALTDGKLDFLLNNAGYGYMMPLMDVDLDAARREYDVNVFGVIAVTQAFFPLLMRAQGMVVNQGSIGGLAASYQPFISMYSSSKAALAMLSDTMRLELAPFGITVVTLITGDVATEFWRNAQGARTGLPESSVYAPIKDKVEDMMRGLSNPTKSANRVEVARKTVEELVSGNPGTHIRRGTLASVSQIFGAIMPWWLLDTVYWRAAQLGKLRAALSGSGGAAEKKAN